MFLPCFKFYCSPADVQIINWMRFHRFTQCVQWLDNVFDLDFIGSFVTYWKIKTQLHAFQHNVYL